MKTITYKRILFLFICMYIFIIPFPIENINIKGLNFIGNRFLDIFLMVIVLLYLIGIIINKNIRKNFIFGIKDFFTNFTSIFMMVLFLAMIISILYARNKGLAIDESVRFLAYIILFFIIKYEFFQIKYIYVSLSTYIGTVLLYSIFGIYQYFTGALLNKKFIFTYDFGAGERIASTFGNPNSYAAFLILAIFPILMLIIHSKNLKRRVIYSVTFLIVLCNLILTFSRNSWIGFFIGCIILCIIYSWKLLFLIIAGGIGAVFTPEIQHRIKDISDMSQNLSRIKLWKTATYMIKDHPFLGVGNGNFVEYYDQYVKNYKELFYPNYHHYPTHNSYLKVESELGIIGIGSFIGIFVAAFLSLRKLVKTTEYLFVKVFYTGFIASFIAFLFMNISDNLFFIPKVTTYFWILLALAQGAAINKKEKRYKDHILGNMNMY